MGTIDIIKIMMTSLIGGLTGAVVTYVTAFPKRAKEQKIKEKREEEERNKHAKILEKAVQALLRNEIQQRFDEVEARGGITTYELQNINYLFASYKALGGNSYIEGIYDRANSMKIINPTKTRNTTEG